MGIFSNIRRHNKHFLAGGLALLILVLAYPRLVFYVRFDFDFILLILVLPFVIRRQDRIPSIRYGFLSLALLFLFPFLKLSSIYFFAFVSTLFFAYESQFGKLSSIPLFLVIMVSPVAIFVSETVGFEIRLWLTQIASKILGFIDDAYSFSGNVILIGQEEFHVDAECMGLKMVVMAFFVALAFMSYQQYRQMGKQNFVFIPLILIIAYALVILSNLARIVLITFFRSAPDTISHEVIGLICFVGYVVLPLWILIRKLPQKPLEEQRGNAKAIRLPVLYSFSLAFILLFGIFRFTSLGTKDKAKPESMVLPYFLADFKCSVQEHAVLKLVNNNHLIYIKPAAGFYSADHSPIICWKGSGYKISKERILNVGSQHVYFSVLQKERDVLYTTWWYDAGDHKTISQFEWRKKNLLEGKEYRLVNVISDNQNNLIIKTEELLNQNIFLSN